MREEELSFVVSDPHVVYNDAVLHSPWTQRSELPGRSDWSTYRFTVKDVILAVATHRWNRASRRLDVRSWFIGEHPAFAELEPTRAMWSILASQAWQTGGRLSVWFELGLPFDLRLLAEQRTGERLSGHDQMIVDSVARELYIACSDVDSGSLEAASEQAGIAPESVCFHIFRGTWTANQVTSMLTYGLPLNWIFGAHPDPLSGATSYGWLLSQLAGLLAADYALARLGDWRLGVSAGHRIRRVPEGISRYRTDEKVVLKEAGFVDVDSFVGVPAATTFELRPICCWSPRDLIDNIEAELSFPGEGTAPILAVPMDWLYLPDDQRAKVRHLVEAANFGLVLVGVTWNQLCTEAELRLAITGEREDSEEVDADNARRFAD